MYFFFWKNWARNYKIFIKIEAERPISKYYFQSYNLK